MRLLLIGLADSAIERPQRWLRLGLSKVDLMTLSNEGIMFERGNSKQVWTLVSRLEWNW
ncbi:MAG: hypothetical protein ACTS4X_01910 [Candidatus Hodgkinia cicadicola]